MPDPRFLLFGYLLLMSLVLFAFMGADKRRAPAPVHRLHSPFERGTSALRRRKMSSFSNFFIIF